VSIWQSGDEEWTPNGSITVAPHIGGAVMHLRGDVDAELLDRVGGAGAFDLPGIAAVDIGELGYIDSSGLTFLVRWAQSRSSAGQNAVIRGTSSRFDQVLSIAGLSGMFVREG
jgi:anti-anti-sigma factor